jgi:hypothetical protein
MHGCERLVQAGPAGTGPGESFIDVCPETIMCAERSSYGRAQSRSRAAFNRDGAIARLLFAVAFSKPGSDSFSIGVSAVVMAPLRGGRPGTGPAVRSGIQARDV